MTKNVKGLACLGYKWLPKLRSVISSDVPKLKHDSIVYFLANKLRFFLRIREMLAYNLVKLS